MINFVPFRIASKDTLRPATRMLAQFRCNLPGNASRI